MKDLKNYELENINIEDLLSETQKNQKEFKIGVYGGCYDSGELSRLKWRIKNGYDTNITLNREVLIKTRAIKDLVNETLKNHKLKNCYFKRCTDTKNQYICYNAIVKSLLLITINNDKITEIKKLVKNDDIYFNFD